MAPTCEGREKAQQEVEERWYKRMAVPRSGSSIARMTMDLCAIYERFRDFLVVPKSPELINTHLFHTVGQRTFIKEEVNGSFSLFWKSGTSPEGKEEDTARQTVFLTPLNLLQRTWKRRRFIPMAQFLKRLHMKLVGNATNMLCIGYN